MGAHCCGGVSDLGFLPVGSVMDVMSRRKKYKGKDIYTVRFKNHPLYISMTSNATGIGGYITDVNIHSPVDGEIELNSKVIAINGTSVEGLHIDEITERVVQGDVPMEMTLVRPEGLYPGEHPDPDPKEHIVKK